MLHLVLQIFLKDILEYRKNGAELNKYVLDSWNGFCLQWARARTTNTWWLDPKFSTAQKHIPITNRKSCEMYENLSFFSEKMA